MRSDVRFARRSLLAGGLGMMLGSCVGERRIKIAYNDAPRAWDDGWPIARPEDEGMDVAGLRAAYERFFSENELPSAISLHVARNGRLVAEGYCRSLGDIGRKNAIQSITKTVTSLAIGTTVDAGLLRDLSRPVHDFLPDKLDDDPRKRAITVEHLLTMQSGLDYSNDAFAYDMEQGDVDDSLRTILGRPLGFTPGAEFLYRDCDPHLAAGLLERVEGASLEALVARRLFEPLGIRDWLWLHQRDGTTYGAFGLFLRPRDLLKIGQLLLREGTHRGHRVVSAEWIQRATSAQVATDAATRQLGIDYGYYVWVLPERGAYMTWGHGGQHTYVVPSRQLVIGLTAEPNAGDDGAAGPIERFLSLADTIVAAART